MFRKLFFIGFIGISFQLYSQNYHRIYKERYEWTIEFLEENNEVILKTLNRYNINPEGIIPAIFPELLRYSMFKDVLETFALELIYINYGKEEADFSIGLFQMKPSFIENLELKIREYPELKEKYANIFTSDTTAKEIRKHRMEKLRSLEGQLVYACCLFDVLETLHPEIKRFNYEDRYKIVATAYNHDFLAPIDELITWSGKKLYPYGIRSTRNKYSYADVGLHFYKKDFERIYKD